MRVVSTCQTLSKSACFPDLFALDRLQRHHAGGSGLLAQNAAHASSVAVSYRTYLRVGRRLRPCCRPRGPKPFRRLPAKVVRSAAHVRNVDRKPCVVRSPRFILRRTINSAMFDSVARRSPGNTCSFWRTDCISISTAMAASAKGTRCSRPAFIRDSGMVQILAARSISSHRAPMTSLVRVAVRITNSSARSNALGA